MNLLGGLIGGVIAGLVGAAVWAGIVYATGYEIGWIAWGVGGLVGIGVAAGSRGASGAQTGFLAVTIAVLSILAGKWAGIHLVIEDAMDEMLAETDGELTELAKSDEFVISFIADEVAAERDEAGFVVSWPDTPDNEMGSPDSADDYDAQIWAEAQTRWDGMTAAAREEYRGDLFEFDGQGSGEGLALFADVAKEEAFKGSFGLFDIVFFGLAIVTAFKIGATGRIGNAEV